MEGTIGRIHTIGRTGRKGMSVTPASTDFSTTRSDDRAEDITSSSNAIIPTAANVSNQGGIITSDSGLVTGGTVILNTKQQQSSRISQSSSRISQSSTRISQSSNHQGLESSLSGQSKSSPSVSSPEHTASTPTSSPSSTVPTSPLSDAGSPTRIVSNSVPSSSENGTIVTTGPQSLEISLPSSSGLKSDSVPPKASTSLGSARSEVSPARSEVSPARSEVSPARSEVSLVSSVSVSEVQQQSIPVTSSQEVSLSPVIKSPIGKKSPLPTVPKAEGSKLFVSPSASRMSSSHDAALLLKGLSKLSPNKMLSISSPTLSLEERFLQLESLLAIGPTLIEGKSINSEMLFDVLIAIYYECQRLVKLIPPITN